MAKLGIFTLSFCLFTVNFVRAAEPLPSTMAAVGDSITAGALAQFTTQSWYDPTDLIGLVYRLFRAKLKDSVEPAERKDLTWFSGANRVKWVHSQYAMLSYLAERQNGAIATYNAAVSGEDSGDALKQMDRVTKWSSQKFNQGAPDYVTIFIGANDLCNDQGVNSTSTEVYRQRINKLVHQVLVGNRKSKVLLMEIPDINRLWQFAKGKKLTRLKKFQSCSTLWRSANLCQNIFSDITPQQRAQAIEQNREYNRVLRETVEQFNSQSGRYGSDRVRLAKGFFDQAYRFEELAIDCFHPNYMGQSGIGWKSFSQTWWAGQFKAQSQDYQSWVSKVITDKSYRKYRPAKWNADEGEKKAQPVQRKRAAGYINHR